MLTVGDDTLIKSHTPTPTLWLGSGATTNSVTVAGPDNRFGEHANNQLPAHLLCMHIGRQSPLLQSVPIHRVHSFSQRFSGIGSVSTCVCCTLLYCLDAERSDGLGWVSKSRSTRFSRSLGGFINRRRNLPSPLSIPASPVSVDPTRVPRGEEGRKEEGGPRRRIITQRWALATWHSQTLSAMQRKGGTSLDGDWAGHGRFPDRVTFGDHRRQCQSSSWKTPLGQRARAQSRRPMLPTVHGGKRRW